MSPTTEPVASRRLTSTHWGTYEVEVAGDRVVALRPFDRDPDPSPIGAGLVDGLPYLTRMFTTISADEMTEDPIFGVSTDLGDVSNQHQADIHVLCDGTIRLYQVVLQDGRSIWIDGNDETWTGVYDESGQVVVDEDPAAREGTMARLRADLPGSERAAQLYETRASAELYDHGPRIDEILAAHNAAVLNGSPYGREDGCACAIGLGPARAAASVLLFLGLVLAWRRKRRS